LRNLGEEAGRIVGGRIRERLGHGVGEFVLLIPIPHIENE
jgi:hypothetical protein